MAEPRKMLTTAEVLDLVPVSRTSLFRMERDGRFPVSMIVAGRKLWFADEVAEWQAGPQQRSRVTRRSKSAA